MGNFSLVNNLSSLSAQSKLGSTTSKLNSTLQRLSSGLRINKSGDDAAGLAIANSFRSDVSVLSQGVRNANDGISTLQIVDGGLNTISGLLDRAATLAAQSASGTFAGNRDTLQSELTKLTSEITRQAQNIGLASSGGADSRFNKAIGVFIGGGVNASGSTNTVSVDLSGAGNRVDAAGLNLASLNIGATAVATSATTATAAGSIGLNASTAAVSAQAISTSAVSSTAFGGAITATGSEGILAAETLTFSQEDGGGSFSVALAAGSKAQDIVDAINNDAGNTFGVEALYDSNTKQISIRANTAAGGVEDFRISSNKAGATGQTGLSGLVDYNSTGPTTTTQTGSALVANEYKLAADEQLTFTGADGKVFSVNVSGGKTAADVVSAINGQAANDFVTAAFDVSTGQLSLTAKTAGTPQSFTVASNRSANDAGQTGLNNASVTYTAANTIAADEKLTFNINGGAQFSVDLKRGDSADVIKEKINSAAGNTYGIVATVSNNTLSVASDLKNPNNAGFTITSDQNASASSSGLNNRSSTFTPAAISSNETLTFTVGSNNFTVDLKSGDKMADIISKINTAGSSYGIKAAAKGTDSNVNLNTLTLTADIAANPNAVDFSVASNVVANNVSGLGNRSVDVTQASGGEAGATAALDAIKAAVAQLGRVQGAVGAGQNNLSQAIDLASTQITNFQAAESSIRDADIAAEASNLARLTTLQQAGVSSLAQANQSSQALLALLR